MVRTYPGDKSQAGNLRYPLTETVNEYGGKIEFSTFKDDIFIDGYFSAHSRA